MFAVKPVMFAVKLYSQDAFSDPVSQFKEKAYSTGAYTPLIYVMMKIFSFNPRSFETGVLQQLKLLQRMGTTGLVLQHGVKFMSLPVHVTRKRKYVFAAYSVYVNFQSQHLLYSKLVLWISHNWL